MILSVFCILESTAKITAISHDHLVMQVATYNGLYYRQTQTLDNFMLVWTAGLPLKYVSLLFRHFVFFWV